MAGLLIAIVNYRVGDLVVEGLRALAPEVAKLPGTQVVVVDNDSGDASCATIQAAIDAEGWGGWARLHASPENVGFGAGNNLAIRPALASADPPDFVLLLNPDTRVLPGALEALLAFAHEHPGAGILGCRVLNEDGSVRRSAFRFPSLRGELMGGLRLGCLSTVWADRVIAPEPRDRPHPTEWVSGAAMLFRRELLEQVGLFDEDYFLYFEEVDLCLRAHRAGWECWYVPQSQVVHLVGKSTGVTGDGRLLRRRPRYWFESRRLFFAKNHGACYATTAHATYAASLLAWKLRRLVQHKPVEDPPHLLRDLVRYTLLPRRSS